MSWFDTVAPDDDGSRALAGSAGSRGARAVGALDGRGRVAVESGPLPTLAWHVAAPGPALAGLLDELEHESLELLDDYDVVEFVAAAQRVAAWAHRLAVAGAGELATRESMHAPVEAELAHGLTPERIAGAELGLRLGITSRAGQDLARTGLALRRELAPTGDALRAGRIDAHKARTILDGLDGMPVPLVVAVQDAVLPRAARRTAGQLAADIRTAIVHLDPAEAARRHRDAAKGRHLAGPKVLPDGMAGLWLHTTATDAHAMYQAIDQAARSRRRAGDPRTLDQLRADLVCERILHGRTTDATAQATVRADVRVLVSLTTLLGTGDEPGELVGHGAIDPVTARALAAGGTWRRLVTDPTSGAVLDVGRTRYTPPADLAEHVRHRDRTCVHPTCQTPAWSSEIDHTVPYRPGRADGGSTAASNLAPLSKGCHQLKTHARFRLQQPTAGRFVWTTPTGHRYVHDPDPPAPGLARDHPLHEHRNTLRDLEPRPENGAQRRRPPGEPPRAGPGESETPPSSGSPPF